MARRRCIGRSVAVFNPFQANGTPGYADSWIIDVADCRWDFATHWLNCVRQSLPGGPNHAIDRLGCRHAAKPESGAVAGPIRLAI